MSCQPPTPIAVFAHANTADLFYDMDWVEWLANGPNNVAATIVSVEWVKGGDAAALVTLHDESIENSNTFARVWVRGTDVGCGDFYLSAVITASDGRVDSRTWLFHLTDAPD